MLKFFIKPLQNNNFMAFTIFFTAWNFSVNFAGPFFNVYMIEHLKMNYFTILLFSQVIANLFTILFIRSWGNLCDKYGSKPVLKLCCLILVIVPLFWLAARPENYLIILLISVFAGICWPGVEMTGLNLSIWLAPQNNRSIYIQSWMF